jgi:hypothetical protein
MYRNLLGLLYLLCVIARLHAQPLLIGNEWINYKQTYIKIPVAQNGRYRLTSTDFQQAGVSLSAVDPTTIQLFHRGIEQAIYVNGEADHRFDPIDFLEFYGQANDGAPDSLLYQPISAQPHAYYSLFNDTTAYFLTWRLDRQPGRRMATYQDTDYASLRPERYHWAEELRVFAETYPGYGAGIPPKIEYSHYEAGEGYTGTIQQKDKPYVNHFTLANPVRDGPPPKLDLLLVGREYTAHQVEVLTGSSPQRTLATLSFARYDNTRLSTDFSWNDVTADGNFSLTTIARGDSLSPTDRYSVSYVRVQYPQRPDASNQPVRVFQLPANSVGRSRLDVINVPTDAQFWDVSDPNTPVRVKVVLTSPDTTRLILRGTHTTRTLLMSSQPITVSAIQPVQFVDWSSHRPTYVIVTHENLRQPASTSLDPVRDYAAYRASVAGGGFDTLTVTMQQLIDQYSYGERHPLAIRRFMTQLLQQSRNADRRPQYLLLLGRSRSTPGIRRDPRQATLDLVMTYGFPGSDSPFTQGLGGFPDNVPAVPTGRINAGTTQDVINYLNKVKEYESQEVGLWRKNLLHLSGGATPNEAVLFRSLVDGYRDKISTFSLGARVTTLTKQTDNLVEALTVAQPVNEGVGLMTFFGHSGLDVTDLDIGFCSSDVLGYRNKGRYPLLLINGCAIGNFFFGRPTLTTDWVLTPDRGAIAAIAHSHLGYVDYLHQYSRTFYDLLADSSRQDQSIGQWQQETMRRVLAQPPNGGSLANCQQMVLQGDPAIRLFPFQTPDYALTTNGIRVSGKDNQPLTTDSDSVRLQLIIQNLGQYRPGQLPLRIRRIANGQETGNFSVMLPQAVAYRDTINLSLPNQRDADGLNQFQVIVNPTDSPALATETNHTNNSASVELSLASQRPALIYPPVNGVISTPTVSLLAQYIAATPQSFLLELDTTRLFNSPFRQLTLITTTSVISHRQTLLPSVGTTYYWRVRQASIDSTQWTIGSFTYHPSPQTSGLPEGLLQLAQPLPTEIWQGDTVHVPLLFTNLSPYAFSDSLLVQQTVYASSLASPQTSQWRVGAPSLNDTLRILSRLPTATLPGLNRLVLTVNPRIQPEYSFQNNTLDLAIPVQPDQQGPLLEVAIDGARIDSEAIVSTKPVIDVLVTDNNRSLIRQDTLGLDMFLQPVGDSQPWQRLNWRNTRTLSQKGAGIFRIQYQSTPLAAGTYQLLVTARDALNNAAAPYWVSFRVVNERRLDEVVTYPNPFQDWTLISWRLTGEQAPERINLTINDLTGKPIRRWHGHPRIGHNEWRWDGRTDAGDLAPSGLYVYQLVLDETTVLPWSGPTSYQGRLLLFR